MDIQADGASEWITLNVGGSTFLTTRRTLTSREPDSMLGRMFATAAGERIKDETTAETNRELANGDKATTSESTPLWQSCRDGSGAYLIDRPGRYFATVLDYLRHGELIIDPGLCLHGVRLEAQFYNLNGLESLISTHLRHLTTVCPCGQREHGGNASGVGQPALTRRDVIGALLHTPADATSKAQLRMQGVNFEGADLSYLDLRYANFRYANLKGANLEHAALSHAVFDRATLKDAKLDYATMYDVQMLCTNAEGASMKHCRFDDPRGQQRANLEGANLKRADLRGSVMPGANLRIASLKNASLEHCDLRCACLAGADLERCNLSGSDLQEANLRGANLTDVTMESMQSALHMSQAL